MMRWSIRRRRHAIGRVRGQIGLASVAIGVAVGVLAAVLPI